MIATEKMYDNKLNENASLQYKVEETITSLNKNVNNHVEIDSKTLSNSNESVPNNKVSKGDDMIINVIVEDNELNENDNNSKVENNELVKDNSQETLRDKIYENDMVVDRKYNNVNDNSSIFKPKKELVDIYMRMIIPQIYFV